MKEETLAEPVPLLCHYSGTGSASVRVSKAGRTCKNGAIDATACSLHDEQAAMKEETLAEPVPLLCHYSGTGSASVRVSKAGRACENGAIDATACSLHDEQAVMKQETLAEPVPREIRKRAASRVGLGR